MVDWNQVIEGDCLEQLSKIPNDTFDMTFADPPFNLDKKYTNYKDLKDNNFYLSWCQQWINEMVRVTKPSGSIFIHNMPKWLIHFASFLQDAHATFRHWIAWDAPSSPMGKSLQPAHYGILYYVKNPTLCKVYELRSAHRRCRKCNILLKDYGGKKHSMHPFGPLVGDVWTDIHRCKHDRYKQNHPCQLPLHLMERLVLLCTDEGDSVLDCFAGTGTTLMAAKRLGRKYLGIEISPDYTELSELKLFFDKSECKINNIWFSAYLDKISTVRDNDIWDRQLKQFKPEWMSWYQKFPDTKERRVKVNSSELVLQAKYQELVNGFCRGK